jgi:hypothetical protein
LSPPSLSPPPSKRLIWFVALWVAGVGSLGLLALVIKLMLGP